MDSMPKRKSASGSETQWNLLAFIALLRVSRWMSPRSEQYLTGQNPGTSETSNHSWDLQTSIDGLSLATPTLLFRSLASCARMLPGYLMEIARRHSTP